MKYKIDTKPTLKALGTSSGCFRRVVLSSVSHSLAPFSSPNRLAQTVMVTPIEYPVCRVSDQR